jgi:demethylmenaquinone methyltransferase/2-methoxy-6-polyprenyl-1,4-benzoquinol methylase
MDAEIKRVPTTREGTKAWYDKISRYYDLVGIIENRFKVPALEMADIKEGEKVLEVGCGTGWALERIARQVGESGKAYGLDISPKMLDVARGRLEKAGLMGRVELVEGDATMMEFPNDMFDAVFASFTLELFDVPDIPVVLAGIVRVLKPGGRFVDVSMSRERVDILIRAYEWVHDRFPQYVDCRPIYVERFLKRAGFRIAGAKRTAMGYGEIACGVKETRK